MASKKQAYELARENVAEPERQLETHRAALPDLEAESTRLEFEAGTALADGADTAGLEARMTALATRQRTERGAIGVLEARLAKAKDAQRQAVAAELRRQADADAEAHAKVEARGAELFAELKGMGIEAMTHPGCPFMHAKQRPEHLLRASELVAAGHECPVDAGSGKRFDRGLW